MAYSDYKRRKALGKRYSVDPALTLDQQRMEQEYGMLPEKRRLAEIQRQYDENARQQGKESKMGALGNLAGLGMQAYSRSGSTLLGDAAKNIASGLFGSAGATAPSYMAAAGVGGAGFGAAGAGAAPLTYGGVAGAGSLSGVAPYAVNPALMGEGVGLGVSGAGTVMGEAAGTSLLGTVGSGVSSILPAIGYHGLRKTGQGLLGGFLQEVGGKNEGGQFASQVGRTISNSSNIEDIPIEWGKELGILGKDWDSHGFAAILNPVGAALDWVSEVTGGMSWLCTATKKHVYLSEEEDTKMKLLKEYALDKHKGWITSYLKHGTTLTTAIAEQVKDINGFYNDLRVILIEPVCANVEKDIEKAYKIYEIIGRMLFRVYMPNLDFREEE